MKSFKRFNAFQFSSILTIIFLLSQSSMSQNLGIKGGLSFSGQNYDYDVSYLTVDRLDETGFTAGFFVSYEVLLLSGLRFELNYVQKGSSIEALYAELNNPIGNNMIRINDRIDYLAFNVLLTPGFSGDLSISPYIIAGPRVDVLLQTSSEYDSPVFDNLKSVIYGATLGLGFSFPVTNSASILIEGVYNYDFTYAYDKDLLKVKNNSILVTTGLSF